VLGGGGLAAVVAKGMFSREYQKAKAGDVKIQAADKVIDILREQIDADRKECDRRISEMQRQLDQERADRARETSTLRERIVQLEQVIQELRR
jgi:polyhydroxyalkanoate synthesis regulator phasin